MVKIKLLYSDISLIIPLKHNIFLHICVSFGSLDILQVFWLQMIDIWIILVYKMQILPEIRFPIKLWIKFESALWAKYPTYSLQNLQKVVLRTPLNIYTNH